MLSINKQMHPHFILIQYFQNAKHKVIRSQPLTKKFLIRLDICFRVVQYIKWGSRGGSRIISEWVRLDQNYRTYFTYSKIQA